MATQRQAQFMSRYGKLVSQRAREISEEEVTCRWCGWEGQNRELKRGRCPKCGKHPTAANVKDEIPVELWKPAKEFLDILQDMYGVPDCENCAAQKECTIFQLFGLENIRAGNPNVEGCSQYRPVEGEEDDDEV